MPYSIALLRISLALILVAPPATTSGQAPTPGIPPEITQAQAALQAGQVDSAITLLEGFFSRNPDATAGWLLLGNAWRQKGNPQKALAAYQKVTVPRLARLQATFNMAAIHAAAGQRDTALALLESLKSTGAFDMELAVTAPEFSSLRSNPRFLTTQFTADDFRNPFVERVKVIHEWVAETRGDQYSWIARSFGDVDGDRVRDIVTSAPTYGAAGQPTGSGRVYVYSGRSGKLLWQYTGEPGENVGIGLEGAGDVNRDGVPDVVAGAPGSGRAFVLSGVNGTVLHKLQSAFTEGFGSSTASAGDQD